MTKEAAMHRLTCWVLAGGCGIGAAVAAPEATELEAVQSLSSAQLRSAYLACDRITSRAVVDPGFMNLCSTVSNTLMERDFGGNLELQLQWWRSARERFDGTPSPVAFEVDASQDP
jgi:hypothetical protein